MRHTAAALVAGSILSLPLACAAAQPPAASAAASGKERTPNSPESARAAALLIGGALSDGVTYERLTELADGIGPRLSGSPGAAAAILWAERKFRDDGVPVHTEPVMVPHWVRGKEAAEIVSPALAGPRPLAITALGGSAATPAGGLTAEVLEVRSLDELSALGEKVRGKLVLFQHPMATAHDYGEYAGLRSLGPLAAAWLGAAGALVRSLATASFRSPHTGMMKVDPAVPAIPGAALATEDAELIHRLLAQGPVSVRLELGCQTLPDAPSFNVVAEVRGSEKPDEIVLLGAHLDSWDLAQGAVDDGAGVVMLMETMRLLARLPTAPRRTVRAVLFINEENGLRGGAAYAEAHASEIGKHVVALECDIGAGAPLSWTVNAGPAAVAIWQPWLKPLETLGCAGLAEGDRGGADLSALQKRPGAPAVVELIQDGTHYFDVHHSAADTLDKVNPRDLAQSTAALAWGAWSLAQMPEAMPRPPAPKAAH